MRTYRVTIPATYTLHVEANSSEEAIEEGIELFIHRANTLPTPNPEFDQAKATEGL